MDLATFRWLLTDDGQALLAAATSAEGRPLEVQRALREVVPGSADDRAARVATALGQVELRRRAAAKLGDDAANMYFTRDGLEQASRTSVARHRAARIAFGGPSVVDLTCGIGGDLVELARAGLTTAGIDLDPLRTEIARANLAALGLGGAVGVGDATELDVTPFATAYADPARRSGRGRTFHADDWAPPWSFVESLLTRHACVKVAPGIAHSLLPAGVEAEWVSDAGEVKEAVLWSPPLATVRRRATVLGRGGLATLTDEDDPGAGTGPVGAFLYEPDGAVIRAGLVTAVAAGVQGHLLDRRIAYLSADAAYRSPFARGYRVVEQLPYREKQLRAALRERGVGTLTIKKRGVDVVPEQLRQRLDLRGDGAATIVLTRVAGEGTALLVEPF
ncbi:MAG TPA: class I SAM-dependent methyltransferase [Nocardioides sp.]|jgi:SAM-dependent methyltransferase|uniref:class I SAM-dependent methyltransferase n=1 Tax=Nocardioides sp. TaxID=35761 RepID=UPI002E306357|nr:class I SAM-dependent methyltransferase [Nocardioides sp.]HEX3932235.1 class I SAM-dependent methyltransferase [Nocardioides sp.]